MWFRLALALGSTVRELQQRMDGREFSEWLAYYQISPFGYDRTDFNAATIAATIAQTRGVNLNVGDYMPEFGKVPHQQSADEMEITFRQFMGAINYGK